MLFEIKKIKSIRKQLGLTQKDLAFRAQISQSLIAKIESGKLDPTYSKVKQIEDVIVNLIDSQALTANDIMVKKIIFCHKKEKVTAVARKLIKYNFSQMPVVEQGVVLGLVTESCVLENSQKDMSNLLVEQIFKESPPIISLETRLPIIISLLKYYSIVLVKNKGKLEGLITRADILKNIEKFK